MCAWLSLRICKCFESYGLVDSDDAELLAEHFSTKSSDLVIARILILAIFTSTIAISFIMPLGFIILSLPSSIFFLTLCLPQVISFILLRIDKEYHAFINILKRKELALFGLNASARSHDSQKFIFAKQHRQKCILRLRVLVNFFDSASHYLCMQLNGVQTSSADELLCNYVNEELISLATVEIDQLSGYDLQLSSLNALWHYMFLLRSEFFRVLILNFPSGIFELFFMKGFMKSLWKIVLLAFEDWSIVSSPSKINVNFDEKYKYAKIPTNRELSIARLEYVLERLNSTKEIPDDPSPIITVLQNVISILDAQNEDSKTQISCPQQTDREEEHEDKVASELFISEDRIPEEEFEIFEVDMALEVDPHLSKSIDRLTTDENFPPTINNPTLLSELGEKLTRRKELCLQQEITALAKCRNVSVDQISPQELDREIFSKTPRTKNASIENPRQLGFTMIPSREDLNKILARREQMFEYNQSSEALFFDDDQPNTSESGL